MSLTVALVIMLLALAGFAVVAVRREADQQPEPAREQLRGFVFVGSGAAVVLAVAVITVSVLVPAWWWRDIVAVLGFFGYCLYLGIAFLLYRQMTGVPQPDARPRHARGAEPD